MAKTPLVGGSVNGSGAKIALPILLKHALTVDHNETINTTVDSKNDGDNLRGSLRPIMASQKTLQSKSLLIEVLVMVLMGKIAPPNQLAKRINFP